MSRYAKGTEVAVSRSRAELEDTLRKFGASAFFSGGDQRSAVVGFEAHGRRVVFRLSLPAETAPEFQRTPTGRARTPSAAKEAHEAEVRRRWRSLVLAIKAKLVAVEEGVETFEEAFLAHVVLPDGGRVADHVAPRIAEAYRSGTMPPLLPAPGGSDDR